MNRVGRAVTSRPKPAAACSGAASVIRERAGRCYYRPSDAMLCAMEDEVPNGGPSSPAADDANGQRTWTNWPCCPHCSRPRLTVCPTCGVAGTCFPLAEFLAPAAPLLSSRSRPTEAESLDDEDVEILLACPQCDEAFPPRFYRHCPECGYDAGEGLPVPQYDFPRLSEETVLAISGLFVLVAALVLYFRWLFSQSPG